MRSWKEHFSGDGGISQMLALALPMVASQVCDTVMIFTDRLFLSRLGPEQMSAAMGGGMMSFTLMTFFMGLTGYSTALVAQYLGAGQRDRCAVATAQALIVSVAAYPIVLACRPLGHLMFAVAKLSPEQLASQKIYFDILLFATIVGLVRGSLSCFFSGIGRTRVVMLSALCASVVNIMLNYALIFGRLGFPALGIRGAAYGTIAGGVCGLLVLAGAYLRREIRTEFKVLEALRLDREIMAKLLRFGYPAGVEFFLNFLAFTGMIMAYHSHGVATAAAVTIVFNWDMVSFVPLIGIEIGVTSLVGRFMGAGQPDTAHRAAMSGMKVGWLYSSVILVLFVFFPEQLVELFRPQGQAEVFMAAKPLAVNMIRLASVYVTIEAAVVVFSGALRGAGDTFWTMCVSVAVHWLVLPVLIVMLHVFGCSPLQAWVALITAFMAFSAVFFLRYRGGKWRSMTLINAPGCDCPPHGPIVETPVSDPIQHISVCKEVD